MLINNVSLVLKPTHVRFECLRDKRANWLVAGLAIPDVSGMHTGRVQYLPSTVKMLFSSWFMGSSDDRKFRQWSGVPTTRNLNNLESSLWWSYRTCPVWMTKGQQQFLNVLSVGSSDVSQKFRRSGVPTCIESSDTSNILTRLQWFSNILRVGSSDVCREFRRSEVLTFIGSSDASQIHCNLVTVVAV